MTIELPPLPMPDYVSNSRHAREYWRAGSVWALMQAADAALEQAALECDSADKSTHPADLADRIRALKTKEPK